MDAQALQAMLATVWKRVLAACAQTEPLRADSGARAAQQLHADRSRQWVDQLACALLRRYPAPDHAVFWRSSNEQNAHLLEQRRQYGLNELLCDILVCRTEPGVGPHGRRYLRHAEWAIESEFSGYGRAVLLDCSKLHLMRASNKLFVCSRSSGIEALLRESAWRQPDERFYLAQLPHPKDWAVGAPSPRLWEVDTTRSWRDIATAVPED